MKGLDPRSSSLSDSCLRVDDLRGDDRGNYGDDSEKLWHLGVVRSVVRADPFLSIIVHPRFTG